MRRRFSALPLIPAVAWLLIPAVAWLPNRTFVGMGTVEPGTGNIIQHAGEAATAPILLDLRAWTSLPFAAALRIGNGRKGNDPYRQYGEDPFPHDHSPNKFDTPSLKKECRISQVKLLSAVFLTFCSESGGHTVQAGRACESKRALLLILVECADQRIGGRGEPA